MAAVSFSNVRRLMFAAAALCVGACQAAPTSSQYGGPLYPPPTQQNITSGTTLEFMHMEQDVCRNADRATDPALNRDLVDACGAMAAAVQASEELDDRVAEAAGCLRSDILSLTEDQGDRMKWLARLADNDKTGRCIGAMGDVVAPFSALNAELYTARETMARAARSALSANSAGVHPN